MPLAIRFVKDYMVWDFSPKDFSWLGEGEIPADPLADLKTTENTLSVYIIGEDRAELDRCVSAFAANKDNIVEISFVLFDEKIIRELGIKFKPHNEELLPDEGVNSLHHNLYELSSQKLVELAKNVLGNCHPDKMDRKQVTELIKNSIANNWIEESKLNRGIKKKLELV